MFNDDIVFGAAGFEFNLARGDAAQNRADIEAEVAADAFIGNNRFACAFFDIDGLMAAVEAADGAAAAADAFGIVDLRDDLEVAVEVFAGNDVGQCFANEIAQGLVTMLFHEDFEAVNEVFDDAVAILHNGGRDLQRFGAEEQEFNGIHPGFDAADARDGNIGEFFVLFELCNEAKGDGLDGCAGVTRNRALAVDDGHTSHVFDVDVANRLDRVDGRDGVSAAFDCAFGRDFHVGDVRGHFGNDGNVCIVLDDAGVFFDEFGILANVRPHGMAGHLRAREVELEHIRTGFGHFAGEQGPFFFIGAHDRNGEYFGGIIFFKTANDFSIFLPGMFRNLLHVFESDEADVFFADVVKTRGAFIHAVDADGFIEDAGPAEIEAFGNHLVVVANRRGRQEERIFAMDAEKIDRNICFFRHVKTPFILSNGFVRNERCLCFLF